MRTATYCALGGAFILSLSLIAAGSTATFAKMTGVSASVPQTVVDRSNKGDRLAVNSTVIRKAPTEAYNAPVKQEQQQSQSRRLLDGCDPLVSPLAGSATAGLTGRCMS